MFAAAHAVGFPVRRDIHADQASACAPDRANEVPRACVRGSPTKAAVHKPGVPGQWLKALVIRVAVQRDGYPRRDGPFHRAIAGGRHRRYPPHLAESGVFADRALERDWLHAVGRHHRNRRWNSRACASAADGFFRQLARIPTAANTPATPIHANETVHVIVERVEGPHHSGPPRPIAVPRPA